MSSKTQDYFKFDNINHLLTTPYYPQANKQIEHLNGALLQIIKKLSIENPKLWYEHLPIALMVIRTWVNQDIRFNPFEIVYGRKLPILMSTITRDIPTANSLACNHVKILEEVTDKIHQSQMRYTKQALIKSDIICNFKKMT